MIYLPEIKPFTMQYSEMDMHPLRVRAVLKANSPLVAYYPPPYLDGLLARAMLDRARRGIGVTDTDEGYWLPVPLRMAWLSPDGLPLWDNSVFQPVGDAVPDMIYTHKRPPKALYCDAKSIKPNVGRWMERRLPLPLSIAPAWEARCIGNADAILDLLKDIAFLGKRRSIGMGEIEEWLVIPDEFDTALTKNGLLHHAIPRDYPQINCDTSPVIVGWTPPQWKVSLGTLGWPVGTAVKTKLDEIDFFAAIDGLGA